VETWGFIWLMFVLKIPIGMLLYIVWWAVRQTPEPVDAEQGDGGTGDRLGGRDPMPRPPAPRRRGPHGAPTPPAPPRTRTAVRSRDRAGR
jgi:hypothetical protein